MEESSSISARVVAGRQLSEVCQAQDLGFLESSSRCAKRERALTGSLTQVHAKRGNRFPLQGYGGDKVQEALQAEAERAGVAGARVLVSDVFPKTEEHAHKRLADVFLDTAPFSAHTTMADALFAGLPAVTWPGELQPSRVGAALAMAAGPGGCVVRTLEEYEEVLVRLVRRKAVRVMWKGKLAASLRKGPEAKESALWDMTAFQVAYEVGLRMAWEAGLCADGGALRHVVVNSRTRERVLREHGLW